MALVGMTVRMMLVAAALAPPLGGARAKMTQQQSNAAWKQATRCAQDAFKKFPDYTPAANAQRETARRECLRNHKLPAPAPAPQASGEAR
jgi:hypothetical protein